MAKFEAGAGGNPKGRKAGVPNATTKALKEAILLAAEQVGEDGKGAAGLTGYLRRVAREDVKAFSTLLGKVLPLQVASDPDQPLKMVIGWQTASDE